MTYTDTYTDLYETPSETASASQALLLSGTATAVRTVPAVGAGGLELTAGASGVRTVHAAASAQLLLTGMGTVVLRDICISAALADPTWAASLDDEWAAGLVPSPWKSEVVAC